MLTNYFKISWRNLMKNKVFSFINIVGLAVGLAIQDILKNFFAGFYLLFERPFRVGDKITVRDHHGTVVEIGLRTTSLRTDDDLQVLRVGHPNEVPNLLLQRLGRGKVSE